MTIYASNQLVKLEELFFDSDIERNPAENQSDEDNVEKIAMSPGELK